MKYLIISDNIFPKFAIKPTIDGRRHDVRESLKVQTMNLAKKASELLSKKLKYPNIRAVESAVVLMTLASIGRIPIALHNVSEYDIFRPSS